MWVLDSFSLPPNSRATVFLWRSRDVLRQVKPTLMLAEDSRSRKITLPLTNKMYSRAYQKNIWNIYCFGLPEHWSSYNRIKCRTRRPLVAGEPLFLTTRKHYHLLPAQLGRNRVQQRLCHVNNLCCLEPRSSLLSALTTAFSPPHLNNYALAWNPHKPWLLSPKGLKTEKSIFIQSSWEQRRSLRDICFLPFLKV